MADDGPWTKYQSAAPAADAGPWAKYQKRPPAPEPQGFGEKALDVTRGAVDVLGTGVLNTGISAANAAARLTERAFGGKGDQPLIKPVELEPPGQRLMAPVGRAIQRAGEVIGPQLDPEVREAGKFWMQPEAERTKQLTEAGHPTLARTMESVGDVAKVAAPFGFGAGAMLEKGLGEETLGFAAAAPVPRTLEQAGKIGLTKGFKTEEEGRSAAVGFRNAQTSHTVAAAVSQPETRKILTNNNADVAQVLAKHDAGVPLDKELTRGTLQEAQKAPLSVYNRAFNGYQRADFAPADRRRIVQLANDLDPDVRRKMRPIAQKLLQRPLTGRQLQSSISKYRMEGFNGISSRDPTQQAIGRAKLAITDVLEKHLEKNLPAESLTNTAQLRAARQALARNYLVQKVRRGRDIDLVKLARIYQQNPNLVKGALGDAAEFASQPINGNFIGKRIPDIAGGTAIRETASGGAAHIAMRAATAVPRMTGIPQKSLRQGMKETAIVQKEGVEAAKHFYSGRDDRVFDPLPYPPGRNLGGRFRAATEGYAPTEPPPPQRPGLPAPPPTSLSDVDSDFQ